MRVLSVGENDQPDGNGIEFALKKTRDWQEQPKCATPSGYHALGVSLQRRKFQPQYEIFCARLPRARYPTNFALSDQGSVAIGHS